MKNKTNKKKNNSKCFLYYIVTYKKYVSVFVLTNTTSVLKISILFWKTKLKLFNWE